MRIDVLILAASLAAPPKPFERTLAGVEVGGPTAAIEKAHPGLHKHRLGPMATLWEACNQGALQVFTFAEEPILCGYVASVGIRLEDDVGVCRDASGALPDLHLQPATPRGVALGATEKEIRAAYGEPTSVQDRGPVRYIRYRQPLEKHPSGATALLLVFTLASGRTRAIWLDITGPMFERPPPPNMVPCRN